MGRKRNQYIPSKNNTTIFSLRITRVLTIRRARYADPNYPVQVNVTKHALLATDVAWRGLARASKTPTSAATDESTCPLPSLTTNFVSKASRARLNYLSHYAEICGIPRRPSIAGKRNKSSENREASLRRSEAQ